MRKSTVQQIMIVLIFNALSILAATASETIAPDSTANPKEWFDENYGRLKRLLYEEKDYTESYRLGNKLLDHVKKHGFQREEAIVLATQGLLFHFIGDEDEAMRHYIKARENFSGTESRADSLRNELNICNTLSALGKKSETINRLKLMAQDTTVRADHNLYCNILMSLYHFTTEDKYAFDANREAELSGNENLKIKTLQNLSGIYYVQGDIEKSLDIQKKVFRFFSERNDPDFIVPLRGIVDIYEQTGTPDSALAYMRRLVAAQDTFSHIESLATISRMKAQIDISHLKADMTQAELRASLERRKSLIIIILSASVIMFGALVWIYQRRKAISEKKLRESENERLAMKLRHEQLQNEHNQNTIDTQERALASKALLQLNKTSMLQDLLTRINEFTESGSLPRNQAKILEKKIREHLNGDRDWEDFTLHFEQVNPRFFSTLKEKYPLLTNKDLKLCAYIKLGFSTKQIASMLSVLPESVNTTRYRLRRKMQLDPDVMLEDVLRDI